MKSLRPNGAIFITKETVTFAMINRVSLPQKKRQNKRIISGLVAVFLCLNKIGTFAVNIRHYQCPIRVTKSVKKIKGLIALSL